MRKRKNQTEHDEMVIALTTHLRHSGHTNVRADIDGYPPPDRITNGRDEAGHIPDVTSTKGCEFVFEVETTDSIRESHTKDQWHLFAADSLEHDKCFVVVVPKGADGLARQRAEELGVAVNDNWTVR